MKTTNIIRNLSFSLFVLSLLFSNNQSAFASCASGSVTLKAPLYAVTIDANRLVTYQQLLGNVVKKAALRSDCVGYTTYTISGTKNLPYPNGTQFLLIGKNDFTSPTPAAIYLAVANGSIDTTVTASGAQTGINSDSFSIYLNNSMVMKVKQPWK
ncbi:hypothetical protein MGMO_129c00030 [Methyloglobulus morosus KoM1]|uniref:Uncharacterized protein n=1 Tax=Methyloglobulus morosus KoM1 TaxID=1116472 RepID=V5BYS8_9GAMM|nr:hypothetical protein [Methyloglobulus morosus]ESS69683.1 hypothetical protein MGMO_129c00030 [Methyloglobulus morosus KoM1]